MTDADVELGHDEAAGSGPPWPARLDPFVVALAALLLLVVHAPAHRLGQLDVVTLNDQVGYVTSARWFAETGELRSHVVCPAFLEVENWRLYMPGHYVELAATFLAFGYGPFQARLPSLAAYVLGAVLVQLLARRLYGRRAAGLAALAFLLFPPVLSYAFTAMSEASFLAAGLFALTAFWFLPRPARWFALPLLLVLPFLFRETGALLVLPAAACALWPRSERDPRGFWITGLGSVLALGLVYAWQTSTGKQSPPLSWISTGKPNYADATLEERLPELGASEWAAAFAGNFTSNVRTLLERLTGEFFSSWEPLFTGTILALGFVTLVVGLRRFRRDPFPLAAGCVFAGTLLFLLLFHKSYEHVAIRHILFTYPLSVIALSGPLAPWLRKKPARLRYGLLALALALSFVGVRGMSKRFVVDAPPAITAELEALGHDDTKLLVAPPQIAMDYALKHYPVRLSFVPDNAATLELLQHAHDIGTLILRQSDTDVPGGYKLLPNELLQHGFRLDRMFTLTDDGRVTDVETNPSGSSLRPQKPGEDPNYLVFKRFR